MKLATLYRERYLPYIQRALKPRTVAEYDRLARVVILPRLGERLITSLTFSDAEELHQTVPGRVQANRAASLLSGMLTYALKRALIPVHPARGIRRNRERGCEFFYSPAECSSILEAALAFPDIRGKYIALALLTGCRPDELRNACPSWRQGDTLRTPDSKTNEPRTIYLSPRACQILDGIAAKDRYFPERMDLRRAWVRIMRAASVPAARRYDLRHSFASTALASGEPLPVIGLMLGHRKYQTTMRYSHLSVKTGLTAAARIAKAYERSNERL